ncbi:RNA polymerase sigma-70 factor [Longitalea arenae]|uniref:RNA polymerase sigma-70 factor n=1 Tax=Longitalea arenae TaxID=2812558 RepID=UPI00196721D5
MQPEVSYSEKGLLLQVINGDAEAFSEIYDLYKDRIFAFAFTLTKSKEIAEEATQEVFVKLWEKRDQINTEYPLIPYIKKITYNYIISFFRKVKLDRQLQQNLYSNMEALRNTNEDELLQKELNKLYRQAIDQLPQQKRMAYTLSREQHLSYEEIALQMGISKNTVRNHMTEAIQFIRNYITSHTDLACLILAICIYRRLG